MSRPIPTDPPDLGAALLAAYANSLLPVTVALTRPQASLPYRAVVLRPALQGAATPVSRYARIGVSSYAARAGGEADTVQAFADCKAMVALLERQDGPLISASLDAGPYEVEDAETGMTYVSATVLATVASA